MFGQNTAHIPVHYPSNTIIGRGTVPFSLINTNNWHRSKVTLTVDIVGDDVKVDFSCSATGLDITKYSDSASEVYKIDGIKTITLMR